MSFFEAAFSKNANMDLGPQLSHSSDWIDGSDLDFMHEWQWIRNDFIRIVPDASNLTLPYKNGLGNEADQCWYSIFIPSDPLIARKSLIYLIRKGIPNHLRHNLWLKISQSFITSEKCISKFHELIGDSKSFGSDYKVEDYNLTEAGFDSLKRILVAVSLSHPELTFCPLIPHAVSLLLNFLNEEETFATIDSMIEQSNERNWYFYTTREDYKLFLITFDELLKSKFPSVYAKMLSLEIKSLEEISVSWFFNFFSSTLPLRIILHIFDCYLNEGIKILYRIGLGLVSLSKDELIKAETKEQFISILKHSFHQLSSDIELFKDSFERHLSRANFVDLFERNTNQTDKIKTPLNIQIFYRPIVTNESQIIEKEKFENIWSFLPKRYAIQDPYLIYDSSKDGYNLYTLCTKTIHHEVNILLFKVFDYVFGFFATCPLKLSKGFYGNAFYLLFTPNVKNILGVRIHKVLFIRMRNLYRLAIGIALRINDELEASTSASLTFSSPPLFEVTEIEFSESFSEEGYKPSRRSISVSSDGEDVNIHLPMNSKKEKKIKTNDTCLIEVPLTYVEIYTVR